MGCPPANIVDMPINSPANIKSFISSSPRYFALSFAKLFLPAYSLSFSKHYHAEGTSIGRGAAQKASWCSVRPMSTGSSAYLSTPKLILSLQCLLVPSSRA